MSAEPHCPDARIVSRGAVTCASRARLWSEDEGRRDSCKTFADSELAHFRLFFTRIPADPLALAFPFCD
ncbi:hypothetical protein E1J21_19755 [Xanthomonas hortorum pv. vitians]|nr:hypothetical protein [Xanthomonas hortorum pv. vitians]